MYRIDTIVRVEYFGFEIVDGGGDPGVMLRQEPETDPPVMAVHERGVLFRSPANYHEPRVALDVVDKPLNARNVGLTPGSWGVFDVPSGLVFLGCIMPSPTDISISLPWRGRTRYRAVHSNPLSLTEETVSKDNETTELFGITLWPG